MRSYHLTFDGGASWCRVYEDDHIEGEARCAVERDGRGRTLVRSLDVPGAAPIVVDWEMLARLEAVRSPAERQAVLGDNSLAGALVEWLFQAKKLVALARAERAGAPGSPSAN